MLNAFATSNLVNTGSTLAKICTSLVQIIHGLSQVYFKGISLHYVLCSLGAESAV